MNELVQASPARHATAHPTRNRPGFGGMLARRTTADNKSATRNTRPPPGPVPHFDGGGMHMNQKQLLRTIEQAKSEEQAELSLSKEGLTELPPELGQLSKLRFLHLGNNQLTALSPELGQLSQLTGLSLWGNLLTALPPELGQLSQLEALILWGNQLTALPLELGQLSQLKTLYLHSNQLTALPLELGQLSQLKTCRGCPVNC
jgi:hypothetical protein